MYEIWDVIISCTGDILGSPVQTGHDVFGTVLGRISVLPTDCALTN